MKKIYLFVILLSMGITQIYAQCYQCTGTNSTSFKIGSNTSATGSNSFAGGNSSATSADNSFVFGNQSIVDGLRGIALGNQARVLQTDGVAIGKNLDSDAANSYVFGQNLYSNAANSITIGMGSSSSKLLSNSKANSIMFGVTQIPSLTITKPANADVGYLGIGTTDPTEQAHVVGKLLIERTANTPSSLQFKHPKTTRSDQQPDTLIAVLVPYYWDIYSDAQGLYFNTVHSKASTVQRLEITRFGSVGIGVSNPKAKLEVGGMVKAANAEIAGKVTANELSVQSASIEGLMCAKEVRVMLSGSPCWPDYVFSSNYNLLPLKELEQFVSENQHLPNVPTAAEVEANGVNIGEMNAVLLKKVEEMTLYIIDLQKQIDELKNSKP